MLIKSLDSKIVINTDTMTSMYVDRREKTIYCTITYSEDEIGCVLGKFETEDIAQQVFDELCKCIQDGKRFVAIKNDKIEAI